MKQKINIIGLSKTLKRIDKSISKITLPLVSKEYMNIILDNLQPSKKTGNLLRSFKLDTRKQYSIISSHLPYASIQDTGGRIRITDSMRKKMWVLFKQTGLPVYKAIAITKKNYIIIPAKNYTKVNINKLLKRINNKLKRDIRNNFIKTR